MEKETELQTVEESLAQSQQAIEIMTIEIEASKEQLREKSDYNDIKAELEGMLVIVIVVFNIFLDLIAFLSSDM